MFNDEELCLTVAGQNVAIYGGGIKLRTVGYRPLVPLVCLDASIQLTRIPDIVTIHNICSNDVVVSCK